MIVGDYGPLGQAIQGSSLVKARMNTLTAQAASGYVADSYAGLGAGAQTPLDLQPQITDLHAQQSAIDSVTGRMNVTQTALTQINALVTGIRSQLASLNNVTPSQIDNVALSARSALQQVAGLLNSADGSVYVFAGTDSANPPVPAAAAIASSPFYTQIGAAVAGLATNGAAATEAATLSVAVSNAAGTTPFAGSPGHAPVLQLGPGTPVQVGVLANANTLVTSGGTSTTGSYMRDILRSLATVANLSSGQANNAGFAALVQGTGASLSGAIAAMGVETGALGDIQSSLAAQKTQASDMGAALTAQVSSVQDVDMAKTLSDLSQVQTQLSASYKLISEMKSLSLVSFL